MGCTRMEHTKMGSNTMNFELQIFYFSFSKNMDLEDNIQQ